MLGPSTLMVSPSRYRLRAAISVNRPLSIAYLQQRVVVEPAAVGRGAGNRHRISLPCSLLDADLYFVQLVAGQTQHARGEADRRAAAGGGLGLGQDGFADVQWRIEWPPADETPHHCVTG